MEMLFVYYGTPTEFSAFLLINYKHVATTWLDKGCEGAMCL